MALSKRPYSPKLLSRKFLVTEKSWNIHTVSFVEHNAKIWRIFLLLRSYVKPIFHNYHFSVTCVIMQKNGAGLHTASSCYWDNSTDGSCTVRWENKTMYCIVSVFGLAIWVKKKNNTSILSRFHKIHYADENVIFLKAE